MKGRRDEAEVIVRIDQGDGLAHICVISWPAMYRKMMRLYGPSLDGGEVSGGARWVIPAKQVHFKRPRELSGRTRMAILAPRHRKNGQSGDMSLGVRVGERGSRP